MSNNRSHHEDLVDQEFGLEPRSRAPDPAPPRVAAAPVRKPKPIFAGYTAAQLVVGVALLLALVWAMWITKTITADKPQRIVKADLSRIVGEYVQAQARSATPPDQVQAQMRTFMASLDTELQRRGAAGQVVLVGEAVLSKSVPDITADVAKAVYASGVKAPVPATRSQMGSMMQGQVPTAPMISPIETAQVAVPVPASNPFGDVPAPVATQDVAPVDPSVAGAMVPTFGGPGGQ